MGRLPRGRVVLTDADRDAFFGEVYRLSTEPFLTPALAAAETASFLRLAQLATGARVLDLGCGWGRHAAGLRAGGMRTIGLDRSRSYLRSAPPVLSSRICADVRRLPLKSGSVDAVACFYSSLFFFEDNENATALGEVARVLRPGGVFVLQTASPLHLRRLGAEERRLALPGGAEVTESIRFDLASGREIGTREVTLATGETRRASFSIRHYAPGELDVLARRAGLRLEEAYGSLELEPFTRHSRDLVVRLRRPA